MKKTRLLPITILCGLITSGHAQTDELAALRADLEAARRANTALAGENRKALRQIETLRQEIAALKNEPEPADTPARIKNPWQLEIAAGGNYASGNSNTYRGNLGLKTVRETPIDQLNLTLNGEYGETSGKLDAERLLTEGIYRRYIENDLYWLANTSFLHDGATGLDYRNTIGPGLGYYFIKNDTLTLLLEGGPAYVWERNEGQAGTSTLRGRIAQQFDWQFTGNAKLFEHIEFLDNLHDTQDWVATLEGGIETSITKTISLRFSGRYQHSNQPATDRKKSDFTALGALVYKFGDTK